jgi:excisionase family DNA binding protein
LYRPAEAATILGCGETTVRKLIRTGELPAVLLNGSLRLADQDLVEFTASLPRFQPK